MQVQEILDKTKVELQLRNYSPKTVKSYLRYIKEYLLFAEEQKFSFKDEAVRAFLLTKQKKKQSPQTINLALNSIRFLYRDILKAPGKIDLKFAKRSKKLPVVLSKSEIKQILSTTKNAKHRLVIALAYGARDFG